MSYANANKIYIRTEFLGLGTTVSLLKSQREIRGRFSSGTIDFKIDAEASAVNVNLENFNFQLPRSIRSGGPVGGPLVELWKLTRNFKLFVGGCLTSGISA